MKALELALLGLLVVGRRSLLLLLVQAPVDLNVILFLVEVAKLAVLGPLAVALEVVFAYGSGPAHLCRQVRGTALLDGLVSDVGR